MPDTDTDADPFVIHFNARVHALKSGLFDRAQLEEMLTQGDLQRMIDTLLESAYRKEMAEALTRYHGADAVEDAVSRNLVDTFQKLIRIAQGDFKELVRLFLMRWDLGAVKSLIRTRHHGIEGDSATASLIPGPTMTVALLQEMSRLESMEALVNALATWNPDLCRRLPARIAAYNEARDPAILEDALDQAYFVSNSRMLRGREDDNSHMLREYLRAEIDRINLRTLFQQLQAGGDKENLANKFLSEGLLSIDTLQTMAAAGDVAGAMEQLANTRYSALVEDFYRFTQTHRFSPMERFFERGMMLRMRRMARKDVFGLGVLLDYAWLKYNEIINLRLIARGLAGNLPTGRVREELYFVEN